MTTFGDWAYWLLCIGVVAVMSALIYAAWWALFSDRAKGRRRCPKCWYDMAYAPPPGMRCPECGYTAQRESQFGKTRRRYGIATAAVLGSVVVAIVVNEQITQRGVVSVLPSRTLLWILPLTSDPSKGVFAELIRRSNSGELSNSQSIALISRCASGDWRAKPVTPAWINKYGNYITDARRFLIGSPQVEQPLLAIPPLVEVTARELWPEGVPVTALVQVRDWWPWGMECRITATSVGTEGAPSVFYRAAGELAARTPFALTLPPVRASVTAIELQLKIERRRHAMKAQGELQAETETSTEPWQHVLTKTVRIPVRVGGELASLIKPASNADMDAEMARVLGNGAMRFDSGISPVRFAVMPHYTYGVAFQDTAVGVAVELRRGDLLARRLKLWWLGGVVHATQPPGRQYGFEIDFEDRELLMQADPSDDRWHMVIRSDPQLAMRVGPASKFWAGEVTVPLKLTLRPGDAPPRPWRVEPADSQ